MQEKITYYLNPEASVMSESVVREVFSAWSDATVTHGIDTLGHLGPCGPT